MIALSLVVLAVALLFFSAFFSGAEMAMTRLSKIKVKHWIHTRSENAEAWANWLSKPQELIATILVGNTLVNIFFSSLMTMAATRLYPDHAQAWVQTGAGAVAFVLLLVFGDIVPKIYCRQNPETVSSVALGPLFRMSKFLGNPLCKLLDLLGRFFPVFKEPTPGRISTLTLDEIRTILLDPASLQGLDKEHQDMMRRVLDLHQTTVSQIMTPWAQVDLLVLDEALAGGVKLERFIDRCIESGRTRLPVVSNTVSAWQMGKSPSRVIGYLYVKDLLAYVAQDKPVTPSQCEKWVRKLPSLLPDKKVGDVLDIFRFGSPMAYVCDRMGFPLGIITLEDILEEFVGEILDEYDLEEKEGANP